MHADDEERIAVRQPGRGPAGRKLLFSLLAALVIAALALVIRELTRSTAPGGTDQPEIARSEPATRADPPRAPPEPPAAEPQAREPVTQDAAPPLPNLEQSDPEIRATLAELLPAVAAPSLAPGQLLPRASVMLANFSTGKILRDKLPLPMPSGKFAVLERGDRTFIAEANYARYDALVGAVREIEPQAIAAWFDRYEPLLQEAFDQLGDGPRSVRQSVISGIDTMLAVPGTGDEIELVRPSVFYKFADPRLEALPDTSKLMIRMGPANREALSAHLRRIREALATPR
jgi:hypothetical protein